MAQSPRRNKKAPEVTAEQAVIEGIFRGIGNLFSLLFRRGEQAAKGLSAASRMELANHWKAVERNLGNKTTHSLAVSEADKVFDATLQALKVDGKNMGERLIAAKDMFSAELYQQLWEAHKLRNTLAHEIGTSVLAHEAEKAAATFRRALRELGVPV